MKINTLIEVCNSRYNVQIETLGFTALECAKLAEFGEPLVDIGGSFTGSLGRPGQTNTVVAISGGGGTGATASVVITGGVITGFVIVAGGSGYTSVPTVTITGDGTGANATAVLTGSVVTSITVGSGGTGYNISPIPISFTFPSALRRLRTDMPIKRVFDLADNLNSDVEAQFYATTIGARLSAAKATLIGMTPPFEGQTLVTV